MGKVASNLREQSSNERALNRKGKMVLEFFSFYLSFFFPFPHFQVLWEPSQKIKFKIKY